MNRCAATIATFGFAVVAMTACRQSGLTADDVATLAEVQTTTPWVYRGQRAVPVSVRLQSHSTQDLEIVEVALTLTQGGKAISEGFSSHLSPEHAPLLEAGGEASWTVLLDVGEEAPLGTVTLDARAWLRQPGTRLVVLDGAAIRADLEIVEPTASLIVRSVTAEDALVYPGQTGVQVATMVENLAGTDADIVAVELRFARGDATVTTQYETTPAADNAAVIRANETLLLHTQVAIAPDAELGVVTLDAALWCRLTDGTLVVVPAARETDTWTVVGQSPLVLDAVASDLIQVYPGQTEATLTFSFTNRSATRLTLTDLRPRFLRAGIEAPTEFVVTADSNNPTQLEAFTSATAAFAVQVSSEAAAGAVTIDGSVSAALPDGTPVSAPASLQPWTWQILDRVLTIPRVVTDTPQVFPGQTGVGVWITVNNFTGEAAAIQAAGLSLTRDGVADITSFTITPRAGNPTVVPANSEVTLVFDATVSFAAAAGLVSIDAFVQAATTGGTVVQVDGAESTTGWLITGEALVLVTTTADENDISGAPSVTAAGGALDVSLREAILIANASSIPLRIAFAPAIFPPAAPTSINVSGTLGALPALGKAGTRLDGTDAGVVIDGTSAPNLDGLTVNAADITIENLMVRNFQGSPRSCIVIAAVNRATIRNCTLSLCGHADGGALVTVNGGTDHRLEGNTLTSSKRDGVTLANNPANVTLVDNDLSANWDDAIEVRGTGHRIEGNQISASGGDGVLVVGASGIVITDNDVTGNAFGGDYRQGGLAGVRVAAGSADIVVENNRLRTNRTGVQVDAGATRVTVSEGVFEANSIVPINLDTTANQDVAAPVIASLTGTTATGTAVDNGTVELYGRTAGGTTLTFLASGPVTSGTWSIDVSGFPSPVIGATVTTAEGSTSELSSLLAPTSDPLVVTTAADELDGGSGIVTVAEAGGTGDLSLREALVLANNRPGADVVTFSPTIFPAATPATIAVAAGTLGGLPTITDAFTTIDGSGAGVRLTGGTAAFGANTGLLTVKANDVTIRALALDSYNAQTGALVYLENASRLLVEACTLSCGFANSRGVYALGTGGAVTVRNNDINGCLDGVRLDGKSASVVSDNRIQSAAASGIYLRTVDGVTVADNIVHHCGGNGIGTDESTAMAISGNSIYANGGSGIAVGYRGYGVTATATFNTCFGNTGYGIWLYFSSGVLRNNIMAGNVAGGLGGYTDDATINCVRDHNLYFNNASDGTTGVKAVRAVLPASLLASDVLADPQFVDGAAGDLTPQAGAIDAGVDTGLDRNGADAGLFNGAAPDIGAIETP